MLNTLKVFSVFNLGKYLGTTSSRFLLYTRVCQFLLNPIVFFIFITLFYLLLLFTFGSPTFCCQGSSTSVDPSEIPQPVPDIKPIVQNLNDRHVYTVDRYFPNEEKFECRLVFGDINRYLGASSEAIQQSMNYTMEIQTIQGIVTVGVEIVTDQQFNTLMDNHPELLQEGVSCTKEYYGDDVRPADRTIAHFIRYSC